MIRGQPLTYVLSAALGLPWVLGFSPLSLWALPVLQVCLLALLVGRACSIRHAFFLGWSFSLAALGAGVSWLYISLHQYGGLPALVAVLSVLALCAYLACFSGLAAAIFWRFRRSTGAVSLALPFVWAGLWTFSEWSRGWVLTGFSWLSLGDVFVDSPFSGLLAWVGGQGAAFLLLVSLMLLLQLLLSEFASLRRLRNMTGQGVLRLKSLGLLAIVLGVVWVCMVNRPALQSEGEFEFAGIQTNVDQSVKFDPEMITGNMEKIFRQGKLARVMIQDQGAIIYPETVNPLVWSDTPLDWLREFRDLAADREGVVITGGALKDGEVYRNAIVLFRGDEEGERLRLPDEFYSKRHLVPFGEFIPLGFQWFVEMMNMPMGEFSRGQGAPQPFAIQDNQVLASICYEDIFPLEFRDLVASATVEPTILLNASNLAWFGQSWALDQHAQMGRSRAAELGKPMIRVTNTGLSGLIGPDGQWIQKVEPHRDTVWHQTLRGQTGKTFFLLWGNWLWAIAWLTVLVLIVARIVAPKAYNSGSF